MNEITKEMTCEKTECASEKRTGKEKRMVMFYKIVCVYLLGGLVGTLWETLLNFISGRGFVFCNGSLFTPFNFVYGFGAVVIVLGLGGQTEAWKVYLMGALGGGAVEYLLNFLEEKLLGTRSWNYADKPLNINGRTTLIYMAFWGLLCLAVVFLIYRPLEKALDKLPVKVMTVIAAVAAVIILLDLIATVGVIIRYAERNAGKEAILRISKYIDKRFNDEFMRRRFPNMNFK